MGSAKVTCAGCFDVFSGKPGDKWCPKCLPTVEPFVVELSAEQRRRLHALSVVRGVPADEVLRQGLAVLLGTVRGKPPIVDDLGQLAVEAMRRGRPKPPPRK